MALKIAVLKETNEFEARVAATPEAVKKYIAKGLTVTVTSGAGTAASYPDKEYEAAGATMATDNDKSAKDADIILCVQAPETLPKSKDGALLIGMLSPYAGKERVGKFADAKLTAISMELVPRITRAQAMDVLSSQSNLAGYKAVLEAAAYYTKAFPMMMTAAGTVPPARVFVMGAGVAGLQAIATARRLGAVVSAYDVRPSSADEVKSMGATFIELELESLEGAGGYAREMTEERAAKQRELLTPYIAKSHVVITTAAVPGRTAPRLMTAAMVDAMEEGTVIVDLAAETGGNVEGSKPGEIVTTSKGVRIWGGKDVPSQLPFHASSLYSRNVVNLLTLMTKPASEGVEVSLDLNFEDEIIDGSAVTHAGVDRKAGK